MRRFRKAFAHRRRRCRIVYAGKALALKAIARIVAEEGLYFDACSEGELQTALQGGVPAARCVLHGCAKTERELELAVSSGVGYTVVDNVEEIEVLGCVTRAAHARIPILVRINAEIAAPTITQVQTSAPQSKFGFPLSDGQAKAAVGHISAQSTLDFRGVHCHLGSQITDLTVYAEAVSRLCAFARSIERDLGVRCDVINVGGGLGLTDHAPEEGGPTPESWAQTIFKALEDQPDHYKVMVEPGRAIVARAGSTLYSIAVRKRLPDGSNVLIVDGGMSDNPRPALYEAEYAVTLPSRSSVPADGLYTIFGRHCETDLLFRDVALPDPRVGDTLQVHGTGAYTYSMASNYNRFPKPAVVLVDGDSARIIARREPPERLFELDVT